MSAAAILVALFAVVVWGASPVATKVAVADLDPVSVAVLRTLLGGLAALPLALALRIGFPAVSSQRLVLLLSSLCGFIGFPLVFSIGVNLTSANHASMILASLPIFTGGIAMAWDRQRPKLYWWIGCAIALAGEVLLISSYRSGAAESSVGGDLIVLLGNLFASLGYVAGARLQQAGYASAGTTFWGVVISAVLLLPVTPWLIGDVGGESVGLDAWLAVAYLAVGVTIVGYIAWYWALGKGGIARIGLIQFLQPVSGVILAWLLLSESISIEFLVASAIILIGIWIAIRAK